MPKLFGLCHSTSPEGRPPISAVGSIPQDPLEKDFRDVAKVESLFATVEAYAQELSGTLSKLKQIPSPFMDGLEKSVGEGSGDEDTWRLFAAQVDTCISRVAGSLSHLETLLLFIPRVRPRFAQVRKAAAKREESWAIKAWHDREVQDVKTQKLSYQAKSVRLNASLQASDNFQNSTIDLQAAMDLVLANRSPDTTTALQLLSECYTGIFGGEARPSLGSLGNISVNDMTNGNEPPDCGALASLGPPHRPPSTDSRAHSSVAASTKMSLPQPALSAVSGSKTQQAHGSTAAPSPSAVQRSTASKAQQVHGGTAAPAHSAAQGGAGSNAQQAHEGTAAPAPPAPAQFAPGEKIEIWSSSRGGWLEGVVVEVFEEGGVHEEYYVPPGVVKVESVAGTKFVQPDQLANVIRKLPP